MNWTRHQGLSSRFKVWNQEVTSILKAAFKDKNEEFKAKTIVNQPLEEYLTQLQRLTDLMDYPDDGLQWFNYS